jgi:hypothetical protein
MTGSDIRSFIRGDMGAFVRFKYGVAFLLTYDPFVKEKIPTVLSVELQSRLPQLLASGCAH